MRRRNQNFDKKFEISRKFHVDWYMMMVGQLSSYQCFEANKKLRRREKGKFIKNCYTRYKTSLSSYINRRGIFCWFRISYQKFDSAYAFRDISDLNKLRGRIRKLFFAFEPSYNLLSIDMHIRYTWPLGGALESKDVKCSFCSLAPPDDYFDLKILN